MSGGRTTVTPLATFRNDTPYPFCPGCGHGPILDALNRALVTAGLDARRLVIVSDIGCSGLSDQYFTTNAFHGLHGRSITYATGIKLARPELEVVVIMGDGGAGIGGAHLIGAARRNIGMTVLVLDNLNFGMTGGQHSPTTPARAVTATTPGGNLEQPMDVCATVAVNGASYVFRGTSFDPDLHERIADGLRAPGFALLDLWELCTAHYVPRNKASKRTLGATMAQLGLAAGVVQERDVPEYTAAYRDACAGEAGKPPLLPRRLTVRHRTSLERPLRIVVAGSAGARIRSSTRLLGEAAMLSGLWATQRDDYPITIRSGHSVSELVLAPEEIRYTGIRSPDALLVLSEDGRRKAARYLDGMGSEGRVFARTGLGPLHTDAEVTAVDPDRAPTRIRPPEVAAYVLFTAVRRLGICPRAALEEAAGLRPEDRAGGLRRLLEAAWNAD